MKVIRNKIILTNLEIEEAMERKKRFKEYASQNKALLSNTGGRFMFLYKYTQLEGWDFSKKGRKAMPKHLRNLPKLPYFYISYKGEIIYL